MEVCIGIDIGGSFIKSGIVSPQGQVLYREKIPTEQKGEDILRKIKEFYCQQKKKYQLFGIGISTPGVIREDGMQQTAGAIKDFIGINLRKVLQEEIDLPIFVENDSKSAAAAERWTGNGQDVQNFVCLTLGTAVGGAIYINGELYRGLGGMAGEFGVALIERGIQQYNEQSFSMHAGVVAGLCRNYSLKVRERVLDAREIFSRMHQGDEIARECIETFYMDAARLLVNTAVTVAPQRILVGGGISENTEAMDGIVETYKRICREYKVLSMVEMPEIKPCHHKNDAGLIGAVYLLLQQEQYFNNLIK